MIIYGLIIPTEIRDHNWDKEMGITTMTVRLGLGGATLFGIFLLTAGLALMVAASAAQFYSMGLASLGVFLIAPMLAVAYVAKQFTSIRSLLKANDGSPDMGGVVALPSRNPKWITLVSQSIVFISLILLAAKIIL